MNDTIGVFISIGHGFDLLVPLWRTHLGFSIPLDSTLSVTVPYDDTICMFYHNIPYNIMLYFAISFF